MHAPLVTIIGPTASGKTDLAIQLARKFNGSVVSADSRQLYAGMDIGTAKPQLDTDSSPEPHDILTADTVDGIPHYLFNIRPPDQPMALTQWQTAAHTVIGHITATDRLPILVGGTMLYVDSILDNYDIPEVAPNIALRTELAAKPATELYQQLLAQDPTAKEFIEPHHQRRIIRALEVIAATGRPFSELRRVRPSQYRHIVIGLASPKLEAKAGLASPSEEASWDLLRERITDRITLMLENGLLDETQTLINRYGADLPLLQTMNYKQTLAVLQGAATTDEARQDMIRANLKYARRQMAWWKRRRDIHWFQFGTGDIALIERLIGNSL